MKATVCGFAYVPDYRFPKSKFGNISANHECRELFIRSVYRSRKRKQKFDHDAYLIATKKLSFLADGSPIDLENGRTKLAVLCLPIAYIKAATDIDVEYMIQDSAIALKMPAKFFFRHWAIVSIIAGLLRIAHRLSHPLNRQLHQKIFRFILLSDVEQAVKEGNKDVLRFVFKHVLKKFEEHEIAQDFLRSDEVREFVLKTLENGSLLDEIKETDWSEMKTLFNPGIKMYLRRFHRSDGDDNNS